MQSLSSSEIHILCAGCIPPWSAPACGDALSWRKATPDHELCKVMMGYAMSALSDAP